MNVDFNFLAGPPDEQLGFAQRQRTGKRVVDAKDAIVDAHASAKGVTAAPDLSPDRLNRFVLLFKKIHTCALIGAGAFITTLI